MTVQFVRLLALVVVPTAIFLLGFIAGRSSTPAKGTPMTFGEAIKNAQNGSRIARVGWNGKGMWVCFMPPTTIPEAQVNERTKPFVPTGDLHVGGYFVIVTPRGIWQPGWLASQADMTATDWEVL